MAELFRASRGFLLRIIKAGILSTLWLFIGNLLKPIQRDLIDFTAATVANVVDSVKLLKAA